jgi:hypothetical protein
MRRKGIGTPPALRNDNQQQDIDMTNSIRKPVDRQPPALKLAAWLCVGMMGLSSLAYAKQQDLPKPVFELIKGQGTEVCDAYLQRLNATEFLDNDPTKGRVTEPMLNGFSDLKTIPLTADEVLRMYNRLKSFEQYQDQSLHEKYYEKYNNIHKYEKGFKPQGQAPTDYIKILMDEHHQKPFVRYEFTLDLDNDGKANDTVIKTTKDTIYSNIILNIKGVFVVDEKLQNVEETKMKDIFADQEILQWPSVTQFPPLAASINLFSYNGKTYFDGFLQVVLSTDHSPTVNLNSPIILGVFIHENYKTHKICEYNWLNSRVYPRPSKYKYDK